MIRLDNCLNVFIDGGELRTRMVDTLGAEFQDLARAEMEKYERAVWKLIQTLRRTDTGWAVLERIHLQGVRTRQQSRPRQLFIRPYLQFAERGPNSSASPHNLRLATQRGKVVRQCSDDPATEENETAHKMIYHDGVHYGTGAGSGSAVRFTPGVPRRTCSKSSCPGAAPDEILLHELVHALRQMTGKINCVVVPDQPRYDTKEELFAIMIANIYRSERGRPLLRADHHGFHPLPAELENNEKFLNHHKNREHVRQLHRQHPELFNALRKVTKASFNPTRFVWTDAEWRMFGGV